MLIEQLRLHLKSLLRNFEHLFFFRFDSGDIQFVASGYFRK